MSRVRVSGAFGPRSIDIRWHADPDPRRDVDASPEKLLGVFSDAIAVGCFGEAAPIARRLRRESIGRGELVTGTLGLPPTHAVAMKCLSNMAAGSPGLIAFEATETGDGAGVLVDAVALPDDLPIGPPPWSLFPSGRLPKSYYRKYATLRVVVPKGKEELAAAPLQRLVDAWGALVRACAFPYEDAGSSCSVEGFDNLFADEFTVKLASVCTDAIGWQALLLALQHFHTTTCRVVRAEILA